jgi:Zn finger protein HypA/HybF involved in hydrogenase expression
MMDWLVCSPAEFFSYFALTVFALFMCVVVPVQLAAKLRRIRLERVRITCRICGYRFLRTDPEATCPHCEARNR